MKLANIHKHYFVLLLIIGGFQSAQAQTWTLQQCIDTAQVHNKNLQMSRNNMAIGEQREKEAKANLIPKVTANADYRYYYNLPYQLLPINAFNPAVPEGQYRAIQFGVPHNINANLQLSMPLYNPQVYGAIQTTKIASELTDLQYQKTWVSTHTAACVGIAGWALAAVGVDALFCDFLSFYRFFNDLY